jgi:hypothetical protein
MDKRSASEEYQAKIRQAEEWVDRATERLEGIAAVAGRQIRQLVARACEEAEDIWAEAQHLRNRKRDNP